MKKNLFNMQEKKEFRLQVTQALEQVHIKK
jgi:hypothetical protein